MLRGAGFSLQEFVDPPGSRQGCGSRCSAACGDARRLGPFGCSSPWQGLVGAGRAWGRATSAEGGEGLDGEAFLQRDDFQAGRGDAGPC